MTDWSWNMAEFERIRKTPELEAMLAGRAEEWVERLNDELHAAQAKRKQRVEDGYVYHISEKGDRLRLYIIAATARAEAHERAHSSILKLMKTTRYDVKTRTQLAEAAAKKAAAKKRRETRRARREAAAKILARRSSSDGAG